MRTFATLALLASAVAVRAGDWRDEWVRNCNRDNNLAYCQEKAKTLDALGSGGAYGQQGMGGAMTGFLQRMQQRADEHSQKGQVTIRATMPRPSEEPTPEQKLRARQNIEEYDKEFSKAFTEMTPKIRLGTEMDGMTSGIECKALKQELSNILYRVEHDGNTTWPENRAGLVRHVEGELYWKVYDYDKTHRYGCFENATPYGDKPKFKREIVEPLMTVLKAEKKIGGETYGPDANFILGKLSMYGPPPFINPYGTFSKDESDAVGYFEKTREYFRGRVSTDPITGLPAFTSTVDGLPRQTLSYQNLDLLGASYELIRAYRDGVGAKKDPAKAQAVARELVSTLGPLYKEDLSFFILNPFKARADAKNAAYFETAWFETVKDVVGPELEAFAAKRAPAAPAALPEAAKP